MLEPLSDHWRFPAESLVSSELNLSGGGWEHDTDNLKHATDNFKRKSASSRRLAKDRQAESRWESGEHHEQGNVVREGRETTQEKRKEKMHALRLGEAV